MSRSVADHMLFYVHSWHWGNLKNVVFFILEVLKLFKLVLNKRKFCSISLRKWKVNTNVPTCRKKLFISDKLLTYKPINNFPDKPISSKMVILHSFPPISANFYLLQKQLKLKGRQNYSKWRWHCWQSQQLMSDTRLQRCQFYGVYLSLLCTYGNDNECNWFSDKTTENNTTLVK